MHLAQQADEERQRKAEEAKREASTYALKRDTLLKAHKEKYFCHICGKPSEGPELDSHGFAGRPHAITEEWDKPRGLTHCSNCGNWVCFSDNCYYRGLCRNCAKSF